MFHRPTCHVAWFSVVVDCLVMCCGVCRHRHGTVCLVAVHLVEV